MVLGRMSGLAADMDKFFGEEANRTGTVWRWTPAVRCSCRSGGGNPKSNCVLCKGFGWFWPEANERAVRGVVTQATNHREYLITGFLQPDDIVFAPKRKIQVGTNDRFRVARPDMFHINMPAEAVSVKRGPGSTDELPYRIARLREVVWSDTRTGDYVQYRVGRDVVADGATLVWKAEEPSPPSGVQAPPETQFYAVNFDADFDWLVVENPNPRGLTEVSITPKIHLRRRLRDQRQDKRPASTGFDPAAFFPSTP